MSDAYAGLRKAQADLEDTRRDALPPQPHQPSNIAALKAEQAQALPPAPKQAGDYLSYSPRHTMTTDQIAGYNRAAGRWNEEQERHFRADMAQARGGQEGVNLQRYTELAWKHHIETEASKLTPEQVADKIDMLRGSDKALEFEKEQRWAMATGGPLEADKKRQEAAEDILRAGALERGRQIDRAQVLMRQQAPEQAPQQPEQSSKLARIEAQQNAEALNRSQTQQQEIKRSH